MNIIIIGRKYTGKSTLAVYLAREIVKRTNAYKFVVFDPKWCFKSIAYTSELSELDDLLDESELEAVAFRPAKSFAEDDKEQVRRDFSDFCDKIGLDGILREPPKRPVVLLIDEAQYLQEGRYLHPWLSRLIRLATRDKIYVILASHRPIDFSPFVRGQGDEFFIFNVTLPEDLDVIREITSEEAAEVVSRLPDHHALKYDLKERKFTVWKNAKGWFSDLSKDFYREEAKHGRYYFGTGSGSEGSSGSGGVLTAGHHDPDDTPSRERSEQSV